VSSASVSERGLVFDTIVLSAFAKADRLDLLGSLLADSVCFVTDVVRDEIRRGIADWPQLASVDDSEWLNIASLATDEALTAFVEWTTRIGSGARDLGEASVFAFAEIHQATALTDDGSATRVARSYGLEVHGTLWLIATFCSAEKLTEHAASNLVDALAAVGLRLPCTGSQFPAWARHNALL
jgi:predicted nucleic acid-binding protein